MSGRRSCGAKASQFNLFDLIEIEEDKESPEECRHRHEEKGFHVWKDLPGQRMVWICRSCGNIRGRIDNR